MVVVNVGIKTGRPASHINQSQFTHRREIGQSLVHSPQRDTWHVNTGDRKQGVRSRVTFVLVHQTKEQLPLRRHFETTCTKFCS